MESTSYEVDSSKDDTTKNGISSTVTPNKQTTTGAEETIAEEDENSLGDIISLQS